MGALAPGEVVTYTPPMARNRTRPVEGDYVPAQRPEGPIAKQLREGIAAYVEREGGLALVEMAARGALSQSLYALLRLGLELEETKQERTPAEVSRRLLTAVPKTALDGPMTPVAHVRPHP